MGDLLLLKAHLGQPASFIRRRHDPLLRTVGIDLAWTAAERTAGWRKDAFQASRPIVSLIKLSCRRGKETPEPAPWHPSSERHTKVVSPTQCGSVISPSPAVVQTDCGQQVIMPLGEGGNAG